MLIEHDKRGTEFSVPLVYQIDHEPRFYIPSNLYLIGLMKLQIVRSRWWIMHSGVDLRFVTLEPKYESDNFKKWLSDRSMKPELVQRIIIKISSLNRVIREDPLLGENYLIGHSYFCPKGENFNALEEKWYEGIVKTEIIPLTKEYWFDNPKKAEEMERNLLKLMSVPTVSENTSSFQWTEYGIPI